jgi:hypothetical protein
MSFQKKPNATRCKNAEGVHNLCILQVILRFLMYNISNNIFYNSSHTPLMLINTTQFKSMK